MKKHLEKYVSTTNFKVTAIFLGYFIRYLINYKF